MLHFSMIVALEVYIVLSIVGILMTSYLYLILREYAKSISVFMLLYLSHLFAALLIYNRASISVFISVIVANFLALFGMVMILYVIGIITKQKVKKEFTLVLFLIYFIYAVIFTYWIPNISIRMVFHNITHILTLSYTLILIFKWKKSHINFQEILSPILILAIINHGFRMINAFAIDITQNDLFTYDKGAFGIMLSSLINLTMIAGFLSFLNSMISISLKESERSKSALLKNVPGFAYRCLNDENWTMEFLSEGFKRITGYETSDVIENSKLSYNDIIHPDYRGIVKSSWESALDKHTNCIVEYQITRKDGTTVWVWEQGVGVCDEKDECQYLEGYIVNIESRKQLEESLRFLSYRDHLTGLYNRRYIEEQISRIASSRNLPITIISIDMNGLKFINDTFGHDQGDIAIQYVAESLKKSLRTYELVARLGGDEFIIILEQSNGDIAKKIIERINVSLQEFKGDFDISIAAGYSTKTSQKQSLIDIAKEAENEMYKAKMYEKPSKSRATIDALLKVLYEKDQYSEEHSTAVASLCRQLANKAGLHQDDVKQAETAGLLHDIGKATIDASILQSKTKLSIEQKDIIKEHSRIGYRILNSVPELVDVAKLILHHHERIDGKGYPRGIKGDEIPYITKMITICDAYDAMTNARYFRKPLSKLEAIDELLANSNTQFDKKLVEIFIKEVIN